MDLSGELSTGVLGLGVEFGAALSVSKGRTWRAVLKKSLLTVVAVGTPLVFFGALNASNLVASQQRPDREQEQTRLKAEVYERLRQWLLLSQNPEVAARYNNDFRGFVQVLARIPSESNVVPMRSTYPEYSKQGFSSLISKLQASLPKPTDKNTRPNLEKDVIRYVANPQLAITNSSASLVERVEEFIVRAGLSDFAPRRPRPPTNVVVR